MGVDIQTVDKINSEMKVIKRIHNIEVKLGKIGKQSLFKKPKTFNPSWAFIPWFVQDDYYLGDIV